MSGRATALSAPQPALVAAPSSPAVSTKGFDQAQSRCDTCGRFLDFPDLCFSKFHFVPLNEFGPEETSWTGPCCRYRLENAQ